MNMVLRDKYDVVIIGGGISGCILANKIRDKSILIVDANDRLMNKIYATGNGRCNLTNLNFDIEKYNSSRIDILDKLIKEYDNKDFLEWLGTQGILTRDIDGYVYPMNFEAKTVVECLSEKLEKNENVDILLGEEISEIGKNCLHIHGRKVYYTNIVLACGGLASRLNKIKHNPLGLLDLKTIEVLPALVPLKSEKKYLKKIDGVRVNVEAKLFIDGELSQVEVGQLQFKSGGVTGIISFQFSSKVARAVNLGKKVSCTFNYIYDKDEKLIYNLLNEDLLNIYNIVPRKLAETLEYLSLRRNDSRKTKVEKLFNILRNHLVDISGVGEFELAQVMSGGYSLEEFDMNLESVKYPHTFVVGEMLDVDGLCGGYNIQWAYTSASIVARKINEDI